MILNRVLIGPRSNFYIEKYEREGFRLGSLESMDGIKNIPRLTREELSAISPFARLFSDTSEIKYIRYTSGTSGSPALLLFRPKQRYKIPGKRPLILTANNQLDVYFAEAERAFPPPYFPPLIHSAQNIKATALLASLYSIDAIVGLPTQILALAKELPMPLCAKITHLFMWGERLTANLIQNLRSYFPNAISDFRYGMTEVGLFGYQCDTLNVNNTGTYHCEPEYLLEVTDTATGEQISENTEGEIVITELYESPSQIIRYRTGDAGKFTKKLCPCGAPFLFEITGRIDHDIIKVAGGVFRVDEIERALSGFTDWFEPDFRGTVSEERLNEETKVSFELHLVPRNALFWHPETTMRAKNEIAERIFLTTSKTLQNFLDEKRISKFELKLISRFPPETKALRLRHIE